MSETEEARRARVLRTRAIACYRPVIEALRDAFSHREEGNAALAKGLHILTTHLERYGCGLDLELWAFTASGAAPGTNVYRLFARITKNTEVDLLLGAMAGHFYIEGALDQHTSVLRRLCGEGA